MPCQWIVCWRLAGFSVACTRSPELMRTGADGNVSEPSSPRKPQCLISTPSGMIIFPLTKIWRSNLRRRPMSGPSIAGSWLRCAIHSSSEGTRPGVAGLAIVEKTHWFSGTVWVKAIVVLLSLPEDPGDLRLGPSCLHSGGDAGSRGGHLLWLVDQAPVGQGAHGVQPARRGLRHLGVAVHRVLLLDEALRRVERRPRIEAGVDRQQHVDPLQRGEPHHVLLDDEP